MRFESEEYTDIPEQLVLKAAWSAMQICITIATENKEISKKYQLHSSFQLTQLNVYASDGTTCLYQFKPDWIIGTATANSGTGVAFYPFFVVKNGDYDQFVFKAYFSKILEFSISSNSKYIFAIIFSTSYIIQFMSK